MMHVGEQVDKSLSISIENPNVLNIPRCTHDTPDVMNVLKMLKNVLNVLKMPPMYS